MAIETTVEIRGTNKFKQWLHGLGHLITMGLVGPSGYMRAKATDTDTGEWAYGYGENEREATTDAIKRLTAHPKTTKRHVPVVK